MGMTEAIHIAEGERPTGSGHRHCPCASAKPQQIPREICGLEADALTGRTFGVTPHWEFGGRLGISAWFLGHRAGGLHAPNWSMAINRMTPSRRN